MYIKAHSAPIFARELARWSADPANVQAYIDTMDGLERCARRKFCSCLLLRRCWEKRRQKMGVFSLRFVHRSRPCPTEELGCSMPFIKFEHK
eukprot:scaffold3967_cov126-Skeletonema_dohrnii-CCMP3373.AAC.7